MYPTKTHTVNYYLYFLKSNTFYSTFFVCFSLILQLPRYKYIQSQGNWIEEVFLYLFTIEYQLQVLIICSGCDLSDGTELIGIYRQEHNIYSGFVG